MLQFLVNHIYISMSKCMHVIRFINRQTSDRFLVLMEIKLLGQRYQIRNLELTE